jgi:hypothetical protein
MKIIKNVTVILIFIVACPLSWVAAWDAGTWFTVSLSVIMPTYGIIYWGLLKIIGSTFLQSLLSWVLGFVGAFISLASFHALTNNPEE